jgi:protein SCO1/2
VRLLTAGLIALFVPACAARHESTGLVVGVDPASAEVTVSHEAIPGYMEAMVMPFTVADARDLRDLQPGDRIAFRIRVRSGRTHIDRLRVLSAAAVDAGLRASPAASTLVKVGGYVPDFTLTNQRGETVSLASLRGQVVAVTFIYTRCPLPDYCPRLLAALDAVRDRFPDRLGKDLAFLTVTFDPKHDTAAILTAYADRHGANVAGWHFLTGSTADIGRVCEMLGVEFWPDEGLITHTLRTAVIDRAGRLAATVEGRGYTGRQLSDLIARVLDQPVGGTLGAGSPAYRLPGVVDGASVRSCGRSASALSQAFAPLAAISRASAIRCSPRIAAAIPK